VWAFDLDADAEKDLLRLPRASLRERVLEHKLLVLRGFRELSVEQLLDLAQTFEPGGSRLLEWPTGPVMNVTIDEHAVNYLFSRERVPLHWDGFFNVEPRLLVFHCVEAPQVGGATLFVDAAKVLDLADDGRKEAWHRIELTYMTEKKAHYGGVATLPLVRRHPRTGRPTLRYAEPVATALNPLTVTCDQLGFEDLAVLFEDLRSRLYDQRVCYEHAWRNGDVVIADNQALLHGRTAIGGGGARSLRRVQIL
jgi:alpha-ketoglutarate-dependent taurine dioxygenase